MLNLFQHLYRLELDARSVVYNQGMDNKLQKAVLKTLAYSDIFDYPLKVSELHQYLIGLRVNNPSTLCFVFNAERPPFAKATGGRRGLTQIGERNGYFFFPGREKIVALRQHREKTSQEKIEKAKKVLHLLKHISLIKMVAVTGAIAAGNADENSDIDLLIVAQKNRLWLARLTAILLLELKGIRRRPPSLRCSSELRGVYKDKICLNMFISEDNLELPNKDLFTANEFVRMKVVLEKDDIYERFIKANDWVKSFLPNWREYTDKSQISNFKCQNYNLNVKSKRSFKIYDLVLIRQLADEICVLRFLEFLARIVQLQYMQERRTTEIVQNDLLMFHPHDAREWVIGEYEKRLRELEIRD